MILNIRNEEELQELNIKIKNELFNKINYTSGTSKYINYSNQLRTKPIDFARRYCNRLNPMFEKCS